MPKEPNTPPLLTREQLAITNQPEKLLTQAEVAEALGVCQETVSRLTVAGRIPFILIGRRGKRYDRQAVVAALSVVNSK